METIIFMVGCWVLIFVEALTDALTYIGWKESDKRAGTFAHNAQIVGGLLCILFGVCLKSIGVNFTFVNCLIMLLTAAAWHELLFDRIYNKMIGKDELGENSLRDRLWKKLGIQTGSLSYNIIILTITFLLTIYLSTKIS